MRFQGTLYRALNPIYAREPLSGRGAELHGGRFNRKGTPAIYTSLSIMTAVRESNQVGNLQPTTLVSYDADIEQVFDSRDEGLLLAHDMEPAVLADTAWRNEMKATGQAKTQAFARRLSEEGYDGLLVRSFAPGATADDLNLVLWRWGSERPVQLKLVDDEKRLRPSQNRQD
ncbi:RES family NAD+ phosphorylase [Rhizobium sp. TRM96647]|jgi:RES domain-containing protein|uniref:RES family NAD+ phosphorylase n=1 Tax=unclassified Rhizobium TaxID=2613769 RepID=UPI0021E772D5|nr:MULTISPECIES: RES family NAD+ phosphorylase [unclassified Rhizobium]MCV3738719.1 RES family NAD+ phosphorylase [Rhizobium sp. TRM96647]MCV3760406.1 RES family NAD+ phosphorylase [Rhizobium sp. TRM96650]